MDGLPELLHTLVLENPACLERLTDCFRNLRNLCATSPAAQRELGQEPVISDAVVAIKLGLDAPTSDGWTLFLRISAQFLANLTVNNPKNQRILWTYCRALFKKMASHGDTKLTDICLMVLYNIMIGCPDVRIFEDNDEFLTVVFESGADGCEFATYIVEHILSKDSDWSKIYNPSIPVRGRLFVLDVIESRLKQSPKSVPEGLILQLGFQFCRQSDCILRTVADRVDSLEPVEVATLLQLLASCLSDEQSYNTLRENKNLLINCAFLLRSIHMAGKEQNNCFTPVEKLSATDETELAAHPAFGFKSNLIRAIGNFCYEHKHNQDLMRELEIIPVLLDCCNIDSRNPYIIQWVVLAVRNLCQDNKENQAVIAGMSRQGLVDSAVLSLCGADGMSSSKQTHSNRTL